ncbi:hypothetical protein [Pseudoduganella violacea]|uniref:Uncharacterized protein n=1 Tax=Pseudoduganella violacea TaxID=1715466 RepID=A0A7W5BEU1_9BURK|nr:hypothetical protein [Pseudoduganella violacea]MBB3121839.1 hypothetical protein [Pseudoduganella violacea]
MSYLDQPRLNFSGMFQADVSTINNDVTNYNNATFTPEKQKLSKDSWNPEGTGNFRLIDCQITGGVLNGKLLSSAQDDPAIGMLLENARERVYGKLVDLDPQQQMVSAIWGMQLRLSDGAGANLFVGDYEPAAFINLWKRQQHESAFHDQTLAAIYQSVLSQVAWKCDHGSPLLAALHAASEQGWLSINMNLYGYGRDPSIPRYTLGHVVGSIGPWRQGSPKHFVPGRQMIPAFSNAMTPAHGVSFFTCLVQEQRRRISADFGNCLPIEGADGGFQNLGRLLLALDRGNPEGPLDTVSAASVAILGEVGYQNGNARAQQDWYARTAGIEDFDYSQLDPWIAQNIGQRPLLLLTPAAGSGEAPSSYQVLVQESFGGLYARADSIVYRLNPDETVAAEMYATRYGQPLATTLVFGTQLGLMASSQPPTINTGKLDYPEQLNTDANGRAQLRIHAPAAGPGNPRGYIDGQLYGIGWQMPAQPKDSPQNIWNFISLLAYDRVAAPAVPAWYPDIQPILQQYANLYPIMSRHLIDLADYDSVAAHVRILDLAFSLPQSDPNHMPVTRDLSDAKRAMILRWLRLPGADGKPLKGKAAAPKAASPAEAEARPALALDPLQTAGKTAVFMAYQAYQARQGGKP